MKLKELLKNIELESVEGSLEIEVEGIACDSRLVKEGHLFIALPGTKADGRQFIPEALRRGARAVISESGSSCPFVSPVTSIQVKNARPAVARISASFYKNPSRRLKVIGITGTNGKTTTTYLLEHMLLNAGLNVGVVGTINYRFGKGHLVPAHNTTPNAVEIQSLLREMADAGVEYVIMEVSSHAIAQYRIGEIDFCACIFTGLSQDHLDYHGTMEEYGRCKARLFLEFAPNALAIINADDKFGRGLIESRGKTLSFGISGKNGDTSRKMGCVPIFPDAKVRASNCETSLDGTRFHMSFLDEETDIRTQLLGAHNIYNILAAAAAARALGLDMEAIKRAVGSFWGVPGRLEALNRPGPALNPSVASGAGPFWVFVDYAHTEEALRCVLSTLRALAPNRVLTVFGAGGERDRLKRPKMGRVASEFSDYCFITSDNPRGESPEAIVEEIIKGIMPGYTNYSVILDRREAIFEAVRFAREDDILLLAGKGHETHQIIGDETLPFDDMAVAREALVNQIKSQAASRKLHAACSL